ncbi:MAG: sulfite exporter TauE/SafE family protein [Actinobacteria bacterium]|nr:sulfite exporter TauE/SafE family protein [Actinomycetota bacterium]
MIVLSVVLAVLVGVCLGLLGGGGSILMVPLLTAVAGMDAKQAIATSLLVVGVTSAIAAITHAMAGRVRWKVAAVFGGAAMAGAFGGGLLARFIPGTVLLIAFALVMLAAGVAMLRGRPGAGSPGRQRISWPTIVVIGLSVGVVSGLVGAGGGFLLVPALTLLADLPMPAAVGTSLVVIAMQSTAGFLGHVASDHVDWAVAGAITGAAVIGSLIGGRLSARIDAAVLRTIFGWFVLAMAAVVLAQEAGPVVGAAVGGATLLAAIVAVVCPRIPRCPLRARRRVVPSRA